MLTILSFFFSDIGRLLEKDLSSDEYEQEPMKVIIMTWPPFLHTSFLAARRGKKERRRSLDGGAQIEDQSL